MPSAVDNGGSDAANQLSPATGANPSSPHQHHPLLGHGGSTSSIQPPTPSLHAHGSFSSPRVGQQPSLLHLQNLSLELVAMVRTPDCALAQAGFTAADALRLAQVRLCVCVCVYICA